MTPKELYSKLQNAQENPILIDIRDSWERKQKNYIPGSFNFALVNLLQDKEPLPFEKGSHLIVYGQKNETTEIAVQFLQAKGFEVTKLEGGFTAWQAYIKKLELKNSN